MASKSASHAVDGLRFQILGPLRVRRDGVEMNVGPRQQACLLALLLARAGRPVSTNELIDRLWGEDAPASAVNVIHKYVGALRRLLEPGLPIRHGGSYLLRHGTGYRFVAGPGQLDLDVFRALVATAKTSLDSEHRVEALEHYTQALELHRGAAAGSLAEDLPASWIFSALDNEFLAVCESAATLGLALGRPAQLLPPLRRAAAMAPLNESVQASYISALAAAGQQAEALSVFRTVRDRLAEDLGIDPGPGLREAQRQVLTQTAMPGTTDHQAGTAPVPVASAMGLLPAFVVRPAQLPPDLPTFVGRDEDLRALEKLFTDRGQPERTSPLIVALDGMGGIGKSTLASHFAHRVSPELIDGQLYLDLQGHDTEQAPVPAAEALRSLLWSLGISGSDIPQTLEARTGAYRSLTAGKRILVLLDNAGSVEQVRPLLPNSAQSLVLVTSRKPLAGLAAFEGAHLLHVDLPDLPSARDLIRRRLEHSPNRTEADITSGAEVLEEIITLCGRLPLALAIVAGRLSARPRLSLATVAAELRDGEAKLAALASEPGVSDPRAAFTWSYHQLSPGAARLFRLLAVTAAPGVSVETGVSLAAEAPSTVRARLRELADAALVEEDEKGRFSSHVLVKAYAHELFRADEPAAEQEAAISRLLQHYLHSSFHAAMALKARRTPVQPPSPLDGVRPERPGTYDEAMQWLENHVAVLIAAVRSAAETGIGLAPWQLALNLQPLLQWSGRFQDWQDVMEVSLRAARDSGDRVGEANSLRSLAGARHSLGANDEALGLLSQALTIFSAEGLLLEEALVHTNFHRVYSELGRYTEALAENERALELNRAGGCRQSEVWALEALGRSLVQLGRPDEALTALEAALRLNQSTGQKPDEPEIRLHTARCLIELGRRPDAVSQLELAVRAARETRHHLDLFHVLLLLGETRLSLGNPAGACDAWRTACDAMHSMQNGGTAGMRQAVIDLGSRLDAVLRPELRAEISHASVPPQHRTHAARTVLAQPAPAPPRRRAG